MTARESKQQYGPPSSEGSFEVHAATMQKHTTRTLASAATFRSDAGFRTDIQALRGIAVLLVLLQHSRIGPFESGYLGVDIFFVISGFLITRMLREQIISGRFSFSKFYFRRAKRLLPAAYATFFATATLAPFLLPATEYKDFLYQLIGSVTFTSNIFLWRQTGYFEGASELKPLLHIWSLSLEEQYYLLLPSIMVLLPRRHWLTCAWALITLSLVLCASLIDPNPTATFYLLPTRAWELGLGSLAALGAFDGTWARAAMQKLFWPALAGLLIVPLTPSTWPHPGPQALLICTCTLVVILRNHPMLETFQPSRMLSVVGDASYSLYLAHWPVLAFLNNAYIGEPPMSARGLSLIVGIVLGVLLWRLVETPIRRMEISPSKSAISLTAMTSILLVATPISLSVAGVGPDDFSNARRPNYGFSAACEYEEDFVPKEECRDSAAPKILVWGDSFAMHLVPGISSITKAGTIQATRSVCGPFLNIAPADKEGKYSTTWAEDCLRFNQSVLHYLEDANSIETVVIASLFSQYLSQQPPDHHWEVLEQSAGGQLSKAAPSVALAVSAMRYTVKRIRALGKKVVIIAPPPSSGFDIGKCLDRKANGMPILGADDNCRVPVADFHRYQSPVLAFLKQLSTESIVNVIRFDDTLCSPQSCSTEIDGTFLYRDKGHLSNDGSKLLAARMHWDRLIAEAR